MKIKHKEALISILLFWVWVAIVVGVTAAILYLIVLLKDYAEVIIPVFAFLLISTIVFFENIHSYEGPNDSIN
jgi:fatty acid desaturase